MIKKLVFLILSAIFFLPATVQAAEGIDVSNYQGNINWTEVASDGVSFALIKATEGTNYSDAYFIQNAEGARNNGIKTGAYHFGRFSNDNQAAAEAEFFLNTISQVTIDYVVALDLETTNGASVSQLTSAAKVFMDTVSNAGYTVVLYSSESFMTTYINRKEFADYGYWVAKFSSTAPSIVTDIWQYTDSGSVNGIAGNVDKNIAYTEYGDLEASTGGNSGGGGGDSSVASNRVSEIQATLNSRYNTGIAEDGIYGPRTHQAIVKGIQTEINLQFGGTLAADGIYGPLSKSTFQNVRYGARGNITYLIQSMLYIEGHYSDSLDGIFGTNTRDAVMQFQRANSLSQDGIVGIQTADALFK